MAEETVIPTDTVETTVVTEEKKEFDPKAFAEAAVESKGPEKKETVAQTTETSEGKDNTAEEEEIHLGNDFVWDNPVKKDETEAKTTETTSAEAKTTTPVIADFSAFTKEVGIEAKDETEFLAKVKEQQKELQELKSLALGGVTSKEIETVSGYLKFDDEKLLRQDMKFSGLDDETINDAVDKFKDAGLLKFEAAKVRATINKFIENKKYEKINADKQKTAQAQQANSDNLKSIREQMNKTDELFGFKIAKPENMQKARDEHYDYLTSGKFLDEITANPEAAIQAAFLWKHRDTIIKTMANKERSKGKQEVLSKLQNTQLPDTGRVHVGKEETEEFNPVKFKEGVLNSG